MGDRTVGAVPSLGTAERRALATLAVLALLALAGCTDSTTRYAVCAACESTGAGDGGGEVHVRMYENGSARWTVRVPADRPSVEATDLAQSLRREHRDGDQYVPAHRGRARNVTGRVVDGDAVVTFRDDGFASEGPGGYLISDAFNQRTEPDAKPYRFGVARVRVTAPDGMTVSNTPPGATVANGGRTVVWGREAGTDDEIHWQTYVVAGPGRSPADRAGANLAVAAAVLEWSGQTLFAALTTGIALAGLTVLGFLWFVTERPLRELVREAAGGPDRWTALTALGPLAVAALTVAWLPPDGKTGYAGPAVFGAPVVWLAFVALGVAVARRSRFVAPLGWFLVATPVPVAALLAGANFSPRTAVSIVGGWTVLVTVLGAVVAAIAVRLTAGEWSVGTGVDRQTR